MKNFNLFRGAIYRPLFFLLISVFILSSCSEQKGNKDAATEKKQLVIADVNPFSGDLTAIGEGRKLYEVKCSDCHGLEGEGGTGPDLRILGARMKKENKKVFKIVYFGTKNGMPTWKEALGTEKIWKVLAYVETLGAKKSQPNKSH